MVSTQYNILLLYATSMRVCTDIVTNKLSVIVIYVIYLSSIILDKCMITIVTI